MWSEVTHVQDPSLRLLANKLPQVVVGSRADSTTATYLCGFKRWGSWASRFPEINVSPASPAFVSLYLLSVLQASTSPAPVQTALYSIRWAHDLTGFQSPTSHTLPQKVLESARRRLSHQKSKKSPMTTQILLKFLQSLDGYLVDTRFMAMALLAYAGFLKFDELSNRRLKDVIPHSTNFELFIESSKTDQYREGAVVQIVKTSTDLCPWANLVKYLSQAKLVLPSSLNGGDDFLFGNIQTKSGTQFVRAGSKISYTRCREISVSKKFADVDLDRASFSWHSFRSGGASSAANGGISDRMLKRHGRWRSENVKDGYVADSLESRLAMTAFHRAIEKGHEGIAKLLLEKKLADVRATDHHRRTALHIATSSENQNIGVIELVLRCQGVEVDALDGFGNTPLKLAAEKGHCETVELLIAKGADVNRADKVIISSMYS
ncbi:Integrase/recombinase xerD-like [Stylophora pistillata]|uniref:Integrase/recombinase xerD-like n=1 Tax=Stylophora pistillata TaxID=50429 RepID=A0A2B4S6M6_STYPI|nr:Integrase/recombinase xerD-like [Stylophora pistillata]